MEKDPNQEKGLVDVERSKEIYHNLNQKLSRDGNEHSKRSSSDATVAEDGSFDLQDFVNVSKELLATAHF